MATCKKCKETIFWAWNEPESRWFPGDLESISGEEKEFDGGVVLEAWHRRHRCKSNVRPEPPPLGRLSPHVVLCVTTNAPPEVIRAAHRALASLHHPDVGGDPVRMAEINDAYDQLRER